MAITASTNGSPGGLFEKLSGSLGSFFEKSTSVVGIDIGSSSIKIVQLAKKYGKVVLETYGELALGPYGQTEVGRAVSIPVDKIGEALKDVIREASVTTKRGSWMRSNPRKMRMGFIL